MKIKNNDLVLLRLPNDLNNKGRQRHYDTWFTVMFIDLDGTFIGRCDRVDKFEFTLYKKGDHIKLYVDKVLHVYKKGEQFCYSDNITICKCEGLRRNK